MSKGLTLFELDWHGTIKPATIKLGSILISYDHQSGEAHQSQTRYADKKEGCQYLWALNQKNAERKFRKFNDNITKTI